MEKITFLWSDSKKIGGHQPPLPSTSYTYAVSGYIQWLHTWDTYNSICILLLPLQRYMVAVLSFPKLMFHNVQYHVP